MRGYAIVVVGLLVVAAVAGTLFLREDDAAYIGRVSKLDARWRDISLQTFKEIIEPSKIGRDYAFNEPLGHHQIAFLVFDSRLAAVRPSKVGACGYFPGSKSIFCDVSFIDKFLADRDFDKKIAPFEGDRPIDQPFDLQALSSDEYDLNRLFMLQWVLGHELGHFLAGHQASNFAPTPLDARVEGKSVSQEKEIEADAFLASHFDPNSDVGARFYQNLIYLLNVEVHRKACPGLSPLQYCDKIQAGAGIFSPATAVYFKAGGSHPEYLIRLVRLLKEAHRRYNLGAIGYLNDKIVDYFKEDADENSCLLGIICR
ncbi:hypothetical protein [Sinorhizobium meliloti]|uniref:hypothetical protein n=1 Tax=Rhizobium meliloti TaxID=382 RepID=UPI00037D49B1|nr:hypothetical protein [Sinorhizobium meliloti]